MAAPPPTTTPDRIPPWRDTRYIALLLQIAFVVAVVLLASYLCSNLTTSLAQRNVPITFSFLRLPANFAIQEGPAFSPSESYARAFMVGIANTLRLSFVGIILATLLGLLVGIARLSSNWLLRTLSYAFVELVRNTPVLLQLFFWLAVSQNLFPPVQESLSLFDRFFFSNRGVYLSWPRGTESFGAWLPWLIGALAAGVALYVWRRRALERRDRPGAVLPWALGAALLVALVGWAVTTLVAGAPLALDVPVRERFNFRGGTSITPAFFSMLMGLTIYTGAFISEIVRAGLLAVSKGQREAARALGLTEGQALRLIILPQALRVIIPPLTNQYLNLTKNSSLAALIGYPDLFSIGFTIFNQTAQTIPMMILVMGSYLTISLVTSLLMNLYNRRVQIVER